MAVVIRAEYQAPGRGPAGLAWDGKQLWLADYREGRIYALNANAEVIGSLWCPGTLSGLTWNGQHLWQALLDEGTLRSIDPVSTDFDQTLDLKPHGLLSGMAWDGANLRVVAQQKGDILTVEPETGTVLNRLPGPVAVGDIDYRDGVLWLSAAMPMIYDDEDGFSWLSDDHEYALVQLDAMTGLEIGRLAAESLYTGLAWADAGTLWLSSSAAGKLYRAEITVD